MAEREEAFGRVTISSYVHLGEKSIANCEILPISCPNWRERPRQRSGWGGDKVPPFRVVQLPVLTSTMSCGALSRCPAGLTWM